MSTALCAGFQHGKADDTTSSTATPGCAGFAIAVRLVARACHLQNHTAPPWRMAMLPKQRKTPRRAGAFGENKRP